MADPRGELERVLHDLGLPVASRDLEFISEGSLRLEANHTVMGNPMRMDTGEIELRRSGVGTSLPGSQHWLVTGATWPLLLRYGYRIGR
jgi:hypothetical protein